MQPKADQASFRDMERRASLMCSFRGRLQLADEERAAAEQAAPKNAVENDPWFALTSRLKGRVDWDGVEHITSREILDALGVGVNDKRAALYRRLTKLMSAHGWSPIRIRLNGVNGGGVTERVRGYQRKTNRLPHAQVSQESPGKIDTSTPYVIGKVVSRLEMDSRWALARSVRALVAERDALKEKLDGNFNSPTGSGEA
jgi:hypothetical protein